MTRMDLGAGPVALDATSAEAHGRADGLTTEVVFTRHFTDVYRIVARLLGPGAGRADTEDVVQQVFLQVHRSLPTFRGDARLTTWLYGIASRVVLTQMRSWRRQRRLVRAVDAELGVPADVRSPEEAAQEREALAQVWRAILRIKPKQRIVYILFELEGQSGEAIAEHLDIKVATVWTRLHHARRALAAALERQQRRAS